MGVSSCADLIRERFGFAVKPRDLTLAFYDGDLSGEVCPIREGRRDIPEHYLPIVVGVLRRRGKLRGVAA